MVNDPRIRQNIFAGESGGDYDALFGFSNRPGGRWGSVKASDMSIADIMAFQGNRGPGSYGQWTKDELQRSGQRPRIATPVGAYQVVGTTLQAAVNALGLDPNTKFDKATQDRIGQWILETQGTGAWEGYGSSGGHTMNASTRSGSPWNDIIMASQQRPKGTPKDMLGAALMSFAHNAPRMHRGQSMDFSGAGGQGDARRVQNQTIEWLRQSGRDDLAAAVAAGGMSAKDAVALVYDDPNSGRATFTQLTPEQVKAAGLDPTKGWQQSSDGKISQIGGGGVNVSVGGDGKNPKMTEGQAKATLFFSIVKEVQPDLDKFEQQGTDFWQSIRPAWMQSSEYRQYDTAATAWAEAYLRATSGATITPEDIKINRNSMFPVPGDPPEVVANKRAVRKAVMQALRLTTGPGSEALPGETNDPYATPAVPGEVDPDPLGLGL